MRNLPDLRRTPARTSSTSDPWEEDQYASLGFESEAPTAKKMRGITPCTSTIPSEAGLILSRF